LNRKGEGVAARIGKNQGKGREGTGYPRIEPQNLKKECEAPKAGKEVL